MTRLLDRVRPAAATQERMTLEQLAQSLSYNGLRYGFGMASTTYGHEPVTPSTEQSAYVGAGVVYGVVQRRIDLFSQVRFAWKRLGSPARPMASDLFTTSALAPLDHPASILGRMELDVALTGNAFLVRTDSGLRRLEPRWVSIASQSPTRPKDHDAWDVEVIGYHYKPPSGADEVFFPGEVAHYAPDPDPSARFRGMSYLAPALTDVANHRGSKTFIRRYWENAATPNSMVTFPPEATKETVEAFRDLFLEKHQGADKAFRTAFLGGGAKLEAVGAGVADLDLSDLTASVVTELCAASGVPSVVLGAVQGMEATTTYNNYNSAIRAFSDFTIRPLWTKAVASLAPLFAAPAGTELWYDPSGIAALQADAKDDAEVLSSQASTMRTLVDGGWTPESVVVAVTTGDLADLEHTGKLSVQLLADGEDSGPKPADESASTVDGGPLGVLDLATALQRIYLAVANKVITADEAREIVNREGAGLGPLPPELQQVLSNDEGRSA